MPCRGIEKKEPLPLAGGTHRAEGTIRNQQHFYGKEGRRAVFVLVAEDRGGDRDRSRSQQLLLILSVYPAFYLSKIVVASFVTLKRKRKDAKIYCT